MNCEAKPDLTKRGVNMQGKVRISQWLWVNLVTKYCGEVIGDEVQLWNRKQVKNIAEMNLETWKHNKEPENMIIKP